MPAPDVARMATLNAGVLTQTLKVFWDQFLYGYGRLHDDALSLLYWLVVLDLGLAALGWIVARLTGLAPLAILAEFFQKVLAYCFWIWLVLTWVTLAPQILNGFVYVGLKGGGSTITVEEFTNPSAIARLGFVATEPIWRHIRNYGWNTAWNLPDILMCGIGGLWILGMFCLIAIEVFVFFLEFYVVAALSVMLLPFGAFRYTGFIADGTFSTLLGHGIKLMVLAFLASVIFPVLYVLVPDKAPSGTGWILPGDQLWGQVLSFALGMTAIALLCWKAPRIALGMIMGGPQLSAGVYAATMVGGMAAATAVGRTMMQSGHQAASLATQAATRLRPTRTPAPANIRPQTP